MAGPSKMYPWNTPGISVGEETQSLGPYQLVPLETPSRRSLKKPTATPVYHTSFYKVSYVSQFLPFPPNPAPPPPLPCQKKTTDLTEFPPDYPPPSMGCPNSDAELWCCWQFTYEEPAVKFSRGTGLNCINTNHMFRDITADVFPNNYGYGIWPGMEYVPVYRSGDPQKPPSSNYPPPLPDP